jgi:hypothetical protein
MNLLESERMDDHTSTHYYLSQKPELIEGFEKESKRWRTILSGYFGEKLVENILLEAKHQFEVLVPEIPYVGGAENHLTNSLIGSVECLAFYQAMKASGKTEVEAGKVLYEAIIARISNPIPEMPPSQRLSEEELMKRRKKRAERSQQREYELDFVYEFVEGDGDVFDYGYNFTECATQKFYITQGAEEFLPFYCFLDFPKSRLFGLGLSRTGTLAEGYKVCDFRFKAGSECEEEWPPLFVKRD